MAGISGSAVSWLSSLFPLPFLLLYIQQWTNRQTRRTDRQMNQHSELECSHCTQVCIQLYIRHTPDTPPSAPPLTWSANPALLRALYSSSLWSGPVCSVDHSQRPPLGRWRQARRYSHGQGRHLVHWLLLLVLLAVG